MGIAKTFKVSTGSSKAVSIEFGSHIGLLLGLVHLGTQKSTYQGETTIKDQLFVQFELQDILTAEGQPVSFGKIMTNSMHEKAVLTKLIKTLGVKDLESGVDFEKLIGHPVMLNFELNKDKTKTSIKSFSPLPTMLKKEVKPLMNTPKLFLEVEDLTDGQKKELPPWILKIVDERIKSGSSSDPIDL